MKLEVEESFGYFFLRPKLSSVGNKHSLFIREFVVIYYKSVIRFRNTLPSDKKVLNAGRWGLNAVNDQALRTTDEGQKNENKFLSEMY